ncbi:hypothetical protein AYX15_07171 [Cryptococcus neoformans]|nr:hypothetical protein AYX15_07171 [Cryptococcus neoformans var. grubii]
MVRTSGGEGSALTLSPVQRRASGEARQDIGMKGRLKGKAKRKLRDCQRPLSNMLLPKSIHIGGTGQENTL